jgi:hypothetical protein
VSAIKAVTNKAIVSKSETWRERERERNSQNKCFAGSLVAE